MGRMHTEWTRQDLRGTFRAVDTWWDVLVEGLDDDVLTAAPAHGAPSVAQLRDADVAARAPFGATGPDDLDTAIALAEATLQRLSAAGRTVAALGAGAPPMTGTVVDVFASDGGVPKLPVGSARVGPRGVEGDRQAARKHHGRVWQALCLWSADVVAALAAEGHDIAPGRAGENISVRGVDWARLRPGTRLRLGEVLAEVTVPTTPCYKNARWFRDGDFMRMSHARQPGVSRLYACVVEPGRVAAGDPVVVEPEQAGAQGVARGLIGGSIG